MLQTKKKIEEQVRMLEKQIKEFPPGKLVGAKNGNYYQWYQSDGHKTEYIPKKNKELIEKLAIKKYLTCQLEDLSNEKKAIESFLKYYKEEIPKTEILLQEDTEYRNLIAPYFKLKSDELQEWAHASFEQNPNHKEDLIHKSVSGNLVRSKSEAIIDTLLYTNHIPFRYECVLIFDKLKYYPDFTIKHPKTGKIYYWEHLGLMEKEGYVKKSFSKLQTYALNGIIPTINLIITCETKDSPLSADVVTRIIEEYFLT